MSGSGPGRWRALIAGGVLLALGLGAGLGIARCGGTVTLASLSPDETARAWLVEQPHWIDRNFELRLEDLRSGTMTTLFRSPDEGRPIGTERIVWSADSSRFVLLGRHFLTLPEGRLPDGEHLYLLYDRATGQLWCNAAQQRRWPAFSLDDLTATHWHEWSAAPRPAPSEPVSHEP